MTTTLQITIPNSPRQETQETATSPTTATSPVDKATATVAWETIKEHGLTQEAVQTKKKEYGDVYDLWSERFRTLDKIGNCAYVAALVTIFVLGGIVFGLHVADIIKETWPLFIYPPGFSIIGIGLISLLTYYKVWQKTGHWYDQARNALADVDYKYFYRPDHIYQTQVDSLRKISNSWEDFCDRLIALKKDA